MVRLREKAGIDKIGKCQICKIMLIVVKYI